MSEVEIAYAVVSEPSGNVGGLELLKVDACYLIRVHDLVGDTPPGCLGSAYSARHAVNSWQKLTGDAGPAFELEKGRLV